MWLLLTGLMFLLLVSTSQTIIAPYQVSIRSSAPAIVGSIPPANDGSVPSKHICSGIIIKDKYILTTAGCVHVQDPQSGLVRLISSSETFIVAGNLSVATTGRILAAGTGSTGNSSSAIRRNVISVIPHEEYNATSGKHDIALLKLDRPLPLQNSPALVQWIDLAGPPPNATSTPMTTPTVAGGGQTPTANNKVNENCFINIYNNSVGPSNYPYTAVRNVSFFEKWICDERRTGKVGLNGRSDGRCVEYRFGGPQSCLLDPEVLRRSEERGTALVCNFKLAAILAEINPPANAHQCVTVHRTTAYYSPIEPYRGWIGDAIGGLYTVGPIATSPVLPGGTNAAPGAVPGQHPVVAPGTGPGSSWGTQQVAATEAAAGKPKSAAVVSFCSGTALKVILFNLFIPFAFIYRFRL